MSIPLEASWIFLLWLRLRQHNLGLKGTLVHAAYSLPTKVIGSLDSHVALLAPTGTPGVSEDEKIRIILGSVADNDDAVVGTIFCRAFGRVEDSRMVLLESSIVCGDEDIDRAIDEGLLDSIFTHPWNFFEPCHLHLDLRFIKLAAGLPLWIIGVKHETSSDGILID